MKNYKKLTISILLLIAMLMTMTLPASATAINMTTGNGYSYPMSYDDPLWNKLSLAQKHEICRIPAEVLKMLTNEELIQAIIDYPFVLTPIAYDDPNYGVEFMETHCDAYAELISREGAKEDMLAYLQRLANQSPDLEVWEIETYTDIMCNIIAYQEAFAEELSAEDMETLGSMSKLWDVVEDDSQVSVCGPIQEGYFVRTPNGSLVEVEVKAACTHDSNYHRENTDNYAAANNGTVIAYTDCTSNCHSYAWYSATTTNPYWMERPAAYMSDGSYTKIADDYSDSNANISVGDRVFWGTNLNPQHSAIVTSVPSGGVVASTYVKGKWGSCGIISCMIGDAAYNGAISVWTR